MDRLRALPRQVLARLLRAAFRRAWPTAYAEATLEHVVSDVRTALRQPWADAVLEAVDLVDEAATVGYPHADGAPRHLLRRWSFDDAFLVRARDVRLYPRSGLVAAPRHGVLLAPSVGSVTDAFGYKRAFKRLAGRAAPGRVPLAIAAPFVRNWFHFAVEDLPGLLDARAAGLRPTVVVPSAGLASVRQCLERLGLPVLETDADAVDVDTALFRTREPEAEFVRPAVARRVRAFGLAAVPDAEVAGEAAPERVYVSRRGSRRRRFEREDELEAALVDRGFEVVRFEDLSFAQHVARLRRARVIVGPHGAGLTHQLWAAEGCTVVEIAPHLRRVGNNCYASLAFALGFGYRHVACEAGDASPYGAIPVDAVMDVVGRVGG